MLGKATIAATASRRLTDQALAVEAKSDKRAIERKDTIMVEWDEEDDESDRKK